MLQAAISELQCTWQHLLTESDQSIAEILENKTHNLFKNLLRLEAKTIKDVKLTEKIDNLIKKQRCG